MTWLRLRRAAYLEFRLTPDMPGKTLFFGPVSSQMPAFLLL